MVPLASLGETFWSVLEVGVPLALAGLYLKRAHTLGQERRPVPGWRQLTASNATLVGVDLVGAGLRKAHEAVPAARLIRADACELPLGDQAVDAIVSANLLEHVPDDRRALREMTRVLRPGATAVVVVPASPGTYDYYDRFLGHERRYARGELAAKARDAGLTPIDSSMPKSRPFA